jgi:hypothetical protein
MSYKEITERYYQRLLSKSLKRHAKAVKSKPMNKFVKEIDWSKLDNFLKTKQNEYRRTNDSNS